MHSRRSFLASLALALVGVALLATACGGGKAAQNGIASLPNVTTPPPPPAATGSGGIPSTASGGVGNGNVIRLKTGSRGAKFSACMRKNGVPNFPDPNGSGVITLDPSQGLAPASPRFRTASQACVKDLPNGGHPSPQQRVSAERRVLAWAKCMRKNGVPDFPDPTFSGSGNFTIRGVAVNPTDPGFQKAMQACRSLAPLGGAGG